jgi:Spy/CpxP family protein refolding chaperone
MKFPKLMTAAAALFAALCLNAQRPRFADGATATSTAGATTTPPGITAVKTYLSLTDSQIAGFDAIRTTAQTAEQPIFEQIRTKQQALNTAMRANPVDATTVASLQTDINTLRAQIDKIDSGARDQMTATLTADQKTKLATLTAAAALSDQIQGASMIGLLARPAGGPGGPGGRGKGKGGPR